MSDETRAQNVVEALSRVIRDLPAIGKDSTASAQQGGYSYRGIEAITRAASPLFAKHGIVFAPQVHEWQPPRELQINNKPWTDERLAVTYRVYGPGGPDDFIEVGPIPAIGRDNSDKGTNKCLTQAFKYALTQTLCIGDGKDDADGVAHEADSRGELSGGWSSITERDEAWERFKGYADRDLSQPVAEKIGAMVEAENITLLTFTKAQSDTIDALVGADVPAAPTHTPLGVDEEPF